MCRSLLPHLAVLKTAASHLPLGGREPIRLSGRSSATRFGSVCRKRNGMAETAAAASNAYTAKNEKPQQLSYYNEAEVRRNSVKGGVWYHDGKTQRAAERR